ncbi:MAG TPA: hypothetical protein VFU13_02015 [Steroidobacteraceae bacterium]|nr:hypothetical protein [Steroidobacteraceae bacterium]
MNGRIFAAYAASCLYAVSDDDVPRVQQNVQTFQTSGLNTLILGLFHIGRDFDIEPKQVLGDIYFNDTLVFSNGDYVGYGSAPGAATSWGKLVASLASGGAIAMTLASIGGASDVIYDFRAIQKIYESNNGSFEGTNLQRNFVRLRSVLPTVGIIDMDNEETYTASRESFTAFCQMIARIGFGITFCPYADTAFWTDSLKVLSSSNPGAVKWWNLQAYAGGTDNDPQGWAQAISKAIPNFDTTGYIVGSDWSRFYNTASQDWEGDFPFSTCPGGSVYSLFKSWAGESAIGGGFLWNADQVFNYEADIRKYGPDPCYDSSGGSMAQYVSAMVTALGGKAGLSP